MKKILKYIGKMIYIFLLVMLIILIIFAVVQKTSDNRKSIGGIKIFTVITGSMIPVYDIGDILIVKEALPEEIKVDDDIVYQGEKGSFKGKTITHRVISIKKKDDGNYGIITKGVANFSQDPEINQTQVLGKVIFNVPIMSFILKIITNIYVWMFIPVIILIRKNIKKIRNM
jgi:signal peptidase